MNPRVLVLASVLGALMWLLIGIAVSHAAQPPPAKPDGMRLAPPVACTAKNRMDIFVDEDNILWECQCQMLMSPPPVCAWQVIGGVDAARIRNKIAAGKLPKRFYWNARYRYIVRLYTRSAR